MPPSQFDWIVHHYVADPQHRASLHGNQLTLTPELPPRGRMAMDIVWLSGFTFVGVYGLVLGFRVPAGEGGVALLAIGVIALGFLAASLLGIANLLTLRITIDLTTGWVTMKNQFRERRVVNLREATGFTIRSHRLRLRATMNFMRFPIRCHLRVLDDGHERYVLLMGMWTEERRAQVTSLVDALLRRFSPSYASTQQGQRPY